MNASPPRAPFGRPLSRVELREIDRRAIEEYSMPGVVLMENAGRGAAELLMRLGIGGPVAICAGKGNNAGDGFVIARHLENDGFDVKVLLFSDPASLRGDAAINYRILAAARTPIVICSRDNPASWSAELRSATWIVDALLGTGTQGQVREPFVAAIHEINAAGVPVMAVDLPSGLDCDTGQPLGACVRARHTATFAAPKLGFSVPGADQYTGQVHVVGIGVPRALLAEIRNHGAACRLSRFELG